MPFVNLKIIKNQVTLEKKKELISGLTDLIVNDKFTFFIGGPLAPDEPIEIIINDVDLDSLCFYSDTECKWKTAIWKDETNDWEIKDFY